MHVCLPPVCLMSVEPRKRHQVGGCDTHLKSPQEAEAGKCLQTRGKPDLHNEMLVSQGSLKRKEGWLSQPSALEQRIKSLELELQMVVSYHEGARNQM